MVMMMMMMMVMVMMMMMMIDDDDYGDDDDDMMMMMMMMMRMMVMVMMMINVCQKRKRLYENQDNKGNKDYVLFVFCFHYNIKKSILSILHKETHSH